MADPVTPPPPFDAAGARITLFRALLQVVARHGRSRVALEDPERQPITYGRLVLGALVLGRKLAALTRQGEHVGLMLPNVQAMAVTLFGLSAYGRVPALLNFTAGVKNLTAAAELAGLRTIVTSRRFVDQARLDDELEALGEGRRIVYLEDIRKQVTSFDKAVGALQSLMPGLAHRSYEAAPDDPAVLLFTSGTEGKPKGVVLSHANLVSNARQIFALAGGILSERDIFMNPLPIFHSFGLTAGLLVPLFHGMKTVLYPSPLHYKQVPKLISETGCTFLLATDTFLQGYARAASPDDLRTVRYVVAGAERVKPETRRMWDPHGTTILEGYGCTECSPVLACNTPLAMRDGSVGRLLPGIEARLEPVEGITDGGRLRVRGPNIMAGYLSADEPGRVVAPEGGWHDTGDIVTIDDGFVVIKGRAKRFAKLGGEMVSLAAVESMISGLWPDQNHVVVALPDARKGEQLILVTEKPDADRSLLQETAKAQGFPELWVPRAILVTNSIPVLGNGKIDYVATRELSGLTPLAPVGPIGEDETRMPVLPAFLLLAMLRTAAFAPALVLLTPGDLVAQGAAPVYERRDECIEAAGMTPEQCEFAYRNARAEFEQKVPRYASRSLCERSHRRCGAQVVATGGWDTLGKGGAATYVPRFIGVRITGEGAARRALPVVEGPARIAFAGRPVNELQDKVAGRQGVAGVAAIRGGRGQDPQQSGPYVKRGDRDDTVRVPMAEKRIGADVAPGLYVDPDGVEWYKPARRR